MYSTFRKILPTEIPFSHILPTEQVRKYNVEFQPLRKPVGQTHFVTNVNDWQITDAVVTQHHSLANNSARTGIEALDYEDKTNVYEKALINSKVNGISEMLWT